MNTKQTAKVIASLELFAPFDNWDDGKGHYFGLAMDGGRIVSDTHLHDVDHEWHICYMGGEIWEIEYSAAPESCTVVYRGKLPTRETFLTIMANVEDSPAWANSQEQSSEE
jgi:hypothetical protein